MKTLFISDLDGTLLNENKIISEKTAELINIAIEKGAKFTIATARSASTAVDMVKSININAPIILMNGVFVYDISKKEYLSYKSIEKNLALHIIEVINSHTTKGRMFTFNGKGLEVYCTDNEIYNDNTTEEYIPYKVVYFTENFEDVVNKNPVVSFVIVDSFENLKPIYKDLKDNPNIFCCFYEDVYAPQVYWLEIYSIEVNKAKAVEFLREYTGAEKVIAFGDNINDMDMLKSADIGCAVANAVTPAKQAADIILEKTNSQDAVALYIIEKILGDNNG